MPVLNSIRRYDGGGNKPCPLVGGELEKRSPCPETLSKNRELILKDIAGIQPSLDGGLCRRRHC